MSLRAIHGGRSGNLSDREHHDLRLLIVDPRSLTRDCLVAALKGARDIETVFAAATAEDAVAMLQPNQRIDSAIINLAADPFGEIELSASTRVLRGAGPIRSIMLLTSLTDATHAAAALKQGVQGFLNSDTPFDLTVAAIRFVSRGWMIYPAFDPAVLQPNLSAPNAHIGENDGYDLTPRQRQVLEGLQRGMTNKDIALMLAVSVRTIKAHVQELMRRIGAANRTQVVAFAMRKSMDDSAL